MDAMDRKNPVYRAEQMFEQWISAVTPDSPTVNCLGDTYQPEAEVRFTDPDAVQRYVDRVLEHLRQKGCNYGGREQTDVAVRPRRGEARATYEYLTRTISIPGRDVGTRSGWALREAVVLHELAHHLAGVNGHGRAFRDTLVRLWEDIGSPVNAHLLAGAFAEEGLSGDLPEEGDEKSLGRIAKLLRQAEGATTEAERDAFMERAQTLATKNSIALAIARQHTAKLEAREVPEFRFTRLGEPGQRGLGMYVWLFQGICSVNDVRITIRTNNTGCTAFGFPSDIDVVEALYASLVVQMVEACESWLETGEYKDEMVWSETKATYVPTPRISARLSFYRAFIGHVHNRLRDAKKVAIAEAEAVEAAALAAWREANPDNTPVSMALALREKEKAVNEFYDDQLVKRGVRGSARGSSTPTIRSVNAAKAGRRAAARASLTGASTRAIG